MNILELIEQKKAGLALSDEQIEWFIAEYMHDGIADYQVSALLMAICFRGMDTRETAALTWAMAKSGEMLDLSGVPGVKVDKHSTGGVADSTTLVVAPLAAACGLPVGKMSGRGLGHTGGTRDKLESIPGLSTDVPAARFVKILKKNSLVLAGQSAHLAPADQKLYALRDVTGTVDSLPLITSSIMSKKLAAGCDAILLDVKWGNGALLPDLEQAEELASAMVALGKEAGRETAAVISDMNQPLGKAVGNALEVAEAVEILKGQHTDGRLLELSLELGAQMLVMGKIAEDHEQAKIMLRQAISDGSGLRKLAQMVKELGGDSSYILEEQRLYSAKYRLECPSALTGYIEEMDVRALGRAAQLMGAGRMQKEDAIDHQVGFVLEVELGQMVRAGDNMAVIYANDQQKGEQCAEMIRSALHIGDEPSSVPPLIYRMLS